MADQETRPPEPASRLFHAGPQSGGRLPAPGRLGLVQAFVNTFFDLGDRRGQDLFATPLELGRWLTARGLGTGEVTPAELARSLMVREALRSELAEHNGQPADLEARAALRDATRGLGAAFALDAGGGTAPVPASAGVDGALGLVMAVVHESQTARTWERLKTCPGHHCGWVFYDTSRNAAGTWCSMQVCGSREKARAYRRRSRPGVRP